MATSSYASSSVSTDPTTTPACSSAPATRNAASPSPNPAITHAYGNKAWVAVDTGFEIQIDEQAGPDGADRHHTGAIYNVGVGQAAGQQDYQHGPALIPGDWNEYEITASGQTYTVTLNGQRTTVFTNQDSFRGQPATADPTSGYLGVQAHTGHVAYRNIRIRKN